MSGNPYDGLFSVPASPEGSMGGGAFGSSIGSMPSGPARERVISQQFDLGNMPEFMRQGLPVTVSSHNGHTGTFWAAPDYLAVGNNEDFLRVPMIPMTAAVVCDAYQAVLPTRKMVNEIWKQFPIKLAPTPMDWHGDMTSTRYFVEHNQLIQTELAGRDPREGVAGHKKDVVVCRDFHLDRVAIYGWHRLDGSVIQGPEIQSSRHSNFYVDYSHGIRLCSRTMLVDGDKYMDIHDVLTSYELWGLLSDEGMYKVTRYPDT